MGTTGEHVLTHLDDVLIGSLVLSSVGIRAPVLCLVRFLCVETFVWSGAVDGALLCGRSTHACRTQSPLVARLAGNTAPPEMMENCYALFNSPWYCYNVATWYCYRQYLGMGVAMLLNCIQK
jgi:hypothetical protein